MLKQDKIDKLNHKTIHLTENEYNKFGEWIDNQNEFDITWNSGISITGNWNIMDNSGNARLAVPSGGKTRGIKDLALLTIGSQNQIDFTLQEVLDILEGNTATKYPGKAYEKAGVMPGDRIKHKDTLNEYIVIHWKDAIDYDIYDEDIYIFGNTTDGLEITNGIEPPYIIKLESEASTIKKDQSTLTANSNYCTCKGPSKLHRYVTFQFYSCVLCGLEKEMV